MSDEIIDSGASGAGARPTFLTVLCILTFIGSGLGAIMQFVGDGAQYMPMWYKLLIVALNAGTGYGAWMMWNLQRTGLMIYTVSQIAAILVPWIILYTVLPSGVANLMSNFLIIASLFPAAFLAMYWANAKHLK